MSAPQRSVKVDNHFIPSVIAPMCDFLAYAYMVDTRCAPSQWETALLCNDVSHWLGANLESALCMSKLNHACQYLVSFVLFHAIVFFLVMFWCINRRVSFRVTFVRIWLKIYMFVNFLNSDYGFWKRFLFAMCEENVQNSKSCWFILARVKKEGLLF